MGKKVLYNNLRFLYILIFLINRFLLYIPTINLPIWVTPLLIIIGLTFIFLDFYRCKLKPSKNYYILMISFLIVYLLSIVCNWERNVFSDFEGFIITLLQMFCFFMYPMQLSVYNIKKQVRYLGITVIAFSFICACISIYHFVNQMYFQIGDIPAWGKIYGFVRGRLYGIYVDPNLGAVIACFSIFFSQFLKRVRINFFLNINIFLQISYLILSGSRTGLVCFAGCIFIINFLSYRERFFKYWNGGQAFIKASFFLILCIGFLSVYEKSLAYLPAIKTKIETYFTFQESINIPISYMDNSQQSSVAIPAPADLSRTELEGNSSNGRIQLWKDGLQIFISSPVIGVGKNNIQDVARVICPDGDLATLNMTTHCGYLELLISVGLLGFFIMIFFLFFGIMKYLVYIWRKVTLSSLDKCLGCIIFISLISAMFLAEIFIVNTFISNFFWLFFGYALSVTQQYKCKGERE